MFRAMLSDRDEKQGIYMLSEKLLSELYQLNRAEKLRVIQVLANELAQEEALLNPDVEYEIWSPYDSAEAAATLQQVLEEHKKSHRE
jgi:hypothetical protein